MFTMIGVRFSCILTLLKLTVALNSDGLCSFVETYTDRVTYIKAITVTIPVTKSCGIFYRRTCYEYQDRIKTELGVMNIKKSRYINRCCEGYISENSKCIPVCSVPCLNGLCTEPEICTCSSGYHKNDSAVCIKSECDPAIPDECKNGTCSPNGICTCNQGFVKSDSYLESSVESKCLPKCSDGCLNGNCVLPEECACNSGYEVFNSSMCSPICEEPCLYGTCNEPNKCICFEGYQLQNDSYHMCNPVCSSGCLNGNCVKPDLCLCDDGFEFSEESKICEPVCDIECVNSNCTSPNICTCEMGFTPSNSTHCVIICENCTHGYCEEPNVCQCDIGYHMNIEEVCVLNECTSNLMEDSCENGFCSDFICQCDSGYRKNATMACSPICSLECVNGYCSEPEVCQCYMGYDFSTINVTDDGNCNNCTSFTQWNVCHAVCEDCYNGTCEDGICNCSDGYVQHPENRGKCIHTAELVYLGNERQSDNHAITIAMSVLGIVLICAVVGLTFWGYVIWNRRSYAVAGVAYQKAKDGISL